jgi:hypothetical protein
MALPQVLRCLTTASAISILASLYQKRSGNRR